jgi:hypothetical protein
VRQASEALQQGQVSQAITAGTRAQRELEQLRDDFRQRTSGRFQEEMRELQESAAELDEKEQEIAQRLQDMQSPSGSPSLRDEGEGERIAEELDQQQRKVAEVMDRIQETVVEAEETEPLLAEHLYETYRETRQSRPERALDDARRSLQRGLFDDAQEQEGLARSGIEQLRAGVDRAAESVLGDETEALRVAHQTLQDLVRQVENELEQVDPRSEQRPARASENAAAEKTPPGPTPGEPPSSKPSPAPAQSPREKQAAQDPTGSRPAGKPQPNSADAAPSGAGRPQPPPASSPAAGEKPPATPQAGGRPSGKPNAQGGRRPPNASPSTPEGLGGFRQLVDESASETTRNFAPITGADFRQWSDRLRDVEEMVAEPELRSQAARVRDRARSFRRDLRRHSEEPNWDLFRERVAEPLVELRDRVGEELLRRVSKDALVPIDRDPVPPKFEEHVRRYYEQLGSGR